MSLLLVVLSLLVILVGGVRNHAAPEAAVLLGLMVVALAAGWLLVRDLRAHPANFPAATATRYRSARSSRR
jgi:hypothetical protein